jgi:mono/diheme cytochrome c family protein
MRNIATGSINFFHFLAGPHPRSQPSLTLRILLLTLVCSVSGSAGPSALGPGVSAQAPALQQEGDAAKGRRIFVTYGCYQCHGREAQGGSAGPRLGPGPLPLAGFIRYVRQPRAEMPPYTAKVLSDADLTDMHAFLRALPRPPAVSALPFDHPTP